MSLVIALLEVRNLILDFDGVIADILTPVTDAMRWVIHYEMRLTPHTDTLIGLCDPAESEAGDHFLAMYNWCRQNNVIPQCTYVQAHDAWWKRYLHVERRAPFLPGALESLDSLRHEVHARDGKMVMATNRTGRSLEHYSHHMRYYFDLIVSPETPGCARKPDPAMLQYAANKLGLKLSETLMIGDGEPDYKAALAADIHYRELLSGRCGIPRNKYEAERFDNLPAFTKWFLVETQSPS